MNPSISVQIICQQYYIPSKKKLVLWTSHVLEKIQPYAELNIRITDEEEARLLNKTWRNKNYATNVLSFTHDLIPHIRPKPIGDIVICAPVINEEATRQQKPKDAHWAHIIIHGTLHLLGFDHAQQDEAIKMEALEIELMSQLGYPNPYP